MMNSENYKIRNPTKEEIPIINAFLEKNFHPEETILQCLLSYYKSTITAEDARQIDEDQRAIIQAMIENHPCQVAVHEPTNKIVAVNIMISSENPAAPIDRIRSRSIDVYETHAPKSAFLRDYFDRMNEMIDDAELFRRFPGASRALEYYAVAVDKEHRMRGLSTLLMREGLRLAKEMGVDLVFGLFTSPFSKRAAENVGLNKVVDIDLLEYRDSEGKRLFEDSEGHNVASIMAILTKDHICENI